MGFLDELKDKAEAFGEKAKDGFEHVKDKAADLVDDVKDRVAGDDDGSGDPMADGGGREEGGFGETSVASDDAATVAAGADDSEAEDAYDEVLEAAQNRVDANETDPPMS